MTAEPIRNLGYAAWRDPYAWMERMSGPRWKKLLAQEHRHAHSLSSQPAVRHLAATMQKEIDQVQEYVHFDGPMIGNGAIAITMRYGGRKLYWNWAWSPHRKVPFTDIDTEGDLVWYITDDDEHPYENILICEDSQGREVWRKRSVGGQLAVIGHDCYYINVLNYFTAVELSVCLAHTGNEERLVYREKDPEKDIRLHCMANRTLYMTSEDAGGSALFVVENHAVKPLYRRSKHQMPLGKDRTGRHAVLTRQGTSDPWTLHGDTIESWHLPNEQIQWVNMLTGLVLTIEEGAQTIWHCQAHKTPRVLYRIRVGTIDPTPWATWENTLPQTFLVRDPFEIPFVIQIVNTQVRHMPSRAAPTQTHAVHLSPLDIHRFHTRSRDGTAVPFIAIKQRGVRPTALLVYVYGAYGSTTPIEWPYQHWYPLLSRKWVIVFALVRGGGDVDEAWAEAARRENRHVSVDDFEACVRGSQRVFRLRPHQTVIYGRSAGGVPVGALVSRYPQGALMGAVFTEVPYVDVLRTTTNPDLPLTKGEYKEFGNPKQHIREFRELLAVSPVNTLPPDGAPGVFVLTHVGLMDQQVLAYESFKWVQRLRGHEEEIEGPPKGKYVTFERQEAHHYRVTHMARFRAVDLAILEAWVRGALHL
jgi:hypothetical protein